MSHKMLTKEQLERLLKPGNTPLFAPRATSFSVRYITSASSILEAPETPEPPISEMPDYIEPIKAYRSWLSVWNRTQGSIPAVRISEAHRELIVQGILNQGDFSLQSISIRNSLVCNWLPKTLQTARCACFAETAFLGNSGKIYNFQPTQQTHQCGVYAWNSEINWHSSEQLLLHELGTGWGLTIHGAVWLWGLVIEHENGYRAEYAYPAEFWQWTNGWGGPKFGSTYAKLMHELSAAWGVPIVEKSAR